MVRLPRTNKSVFLPTAKVRHRRIMFSLTKFSIPSILLPVACVCITAQEPEDFKNLIIPMLQKKPTLGCFILNNFIFYSAPGGLRVPLGCKLTGTSIGPYHIYAMCKINGANRLVKLTLETKIDWYHKGKIVNHIENADRLVESLDSISIEDSDIDISKFKMKPFSCGCDVLNSNHNQ